MTERPERTHHIFGRDITIRRAPRRATTARLWPILLSVGLLLIAAHDYVYRRTAGAEGDYTLGLLSHAAMDMLGLVVVVVLITAYWEYKR